jgi:hypothetical protein
MSQILWTLPIPSTALLRSPTFQVSLGRSCALSCEYEDENDEVVSLKLLFEGVEAFKCTYYRACSVEMINTAYDKVVDVGSTEWKSKIKERLISSNQDVMGLKHLMVYFDDGPCYEFICENFQVDRIADYLE